MADISDVIKDLSRSQPFPFAAVENLSARKRRPANSRARTPDRVRGHAPCIPIPYALYASLYPRRHKSCEVERKRARDRATERERTKWNARHKTYTAGGPRRIFPIHGDAHVYTTRDATHGRSRAHAFRLPPFLRSIFSVPSILLARLLSSIPFFPLSLRPRRSLTSRFFSSLDRAFLPFFLHSVIFSEFRYPPPRGGCTAETHLNLNAFQFYRGTETRKFRSCRNGISYLRRRRSWRFARYATLGDVADDGVGSLYSEFYFSRIDPNQSSSFAVCENKMK